MTKSVLEWGYRSFLIQEHIKRVDPDVFGLCDLDAGVKQKIFSTAIKKLGYQEYHMCNSKIGTSIFYKTAKFTLIEAKYFQYEEISDQIGNLNS
jgi:mRNA deadenylase 3'-5' endonuclease subunit Ccr4